MVRLARRATLNRLIYNELPERICLNCRKSDILDIFSCLANAKLEEIFGLNSEFVAIYENTFLHIISAIGDDDACPVMGC